MAKRILWIEDDYFAIKGLIRPLEKSGFQVEATTSAVEGFRKAADWEQYDLIVVDLILPLADDDGPVPEKVQSWASEPYVGIGLLKWLMLELKVKCHVLILSVIRDPIKTFHLENLGLSGDLPKPGLLPSIVAETVLEMLAEEE